MKKWLVSAALAAGLTLGGCGKTATTEEGGKVRVGVQAVIAGATGITYDLLIEQPSAAGAYEAVVTQAVATTNAPGGDATFVASCIPYAEAARNKVRVTVTLKTVTMANNVASPAPLPQTKTVDAGNCVANADIQAPLTFQLNSGGTGERGFVDTLVTIESTPVNVTAKIDCQQSLLPNPSGTAGAARVPGVVFGLANNASQNLALFLDNPYNKQIYSGTDSAVTPFKFLNAAMYLNTAAAGALSGDGLWLPNAAFFQNGLGYVHYSALTAANGADSCGSTETAPLQYTVAVGGGTITGTSQTVYIVENVDTSNFRVRSALGAALNTAANAALAVKPTAGTATDACWVSKESATFQVLATVDSVLKVFACTAADGCGYSVAYATLANQFKNASTSECGNTVALPVCNPSGAPFGGGTGTEADPYQICSQAQLVASVSVTGTKFFRQDTNIALTGTWTPQAFAGTYDGNSKSISGLTAPLFSVIKAATVRNLTLSGDVSAATAEVGMLAGLAWPSATLTGIVASGSVTGNAGAGDAVGGLVGRCIGKIIGSSFSGDVSGNKQVGGLVGDLVYGGPSSGSLTASTATYGTITVNASGCRSDAAAGGLVGQANGAGASVSANTATGGQILYRGGCEGGGSHIASTSLEVGFNNGASVAGNTTSGTIASF